LFLTNNIIGVLDTAIAFRSGKHTNCVRLSLTIVVFTFKMRP